MPVVSGNSLGGDYDRYEARRIKHLCQSLTRQQKDELRDKILARAYFFGVANPHAYKVALQNLN